MSWGSRAIRTRSSAVAAGALPATDAAVLEGEHELFGAMKLQRRLYALIDEGLALVVDRAHPRPADLHAPAAERHRSVLTPVTLRGPVRVVLVLRAHDFVDLALHQRVHDPEPNAHAQRKQSLPRCPDQLAERILNLRRQRTLQRLHGRDDLRAGYLLHGGSSCPLGLLWHPERSQPERTRREDRHSKFYEISDNLAGGGEAVGPAPVIGGFASDDAELSGITQIQVEPKRGVTFPSALRAILRQDPDVVFVGEIRDLETAGVAVQAAMTAHSRLT